jgi:hypothetical protein
MHGRFANTWEEALVAAAAARESKQQERRYRRMLALTDRLLGRLETLNLSGHQELNAPIRQSIAGTLDRLSPPVRARFPHCDTVQNAVDGVFEVQDELLHRLRQTLRWDPTEAMPGEPELERRTA